MDGLAAFNALPAPDAERALADCCACPAWTRCVAAGRPYPELPALLDAADDALAWLSWSDIAEALAAHPRIGERATGPGRDAAWSRREQAGAAGTAPETAAALVEANRAYERRFGYVFLIFATGRSVAEVLDAARERLGHDDATERRVVREELRKIVRLRLERLVAS